MAEMKGNGNDMENDNKEMHGIGIRTLAVKNGHGNVMFTIGEFKIFSEREVEGSGCGDGFVFRNFHEFSLWKTNCRHNEVSLMITLSSCNL